jgi:hypothetical protein
LTASQNPFSLAPAIFTPFKGISSEPQPALDITEKLLKIIENLPAQQDAVKRNMLALVQQHADNLVARAREELDALEGASDGAMEFEDGEDQAKKESMKNEISSMMARLKAPMKGDAKSKDYELKPGAPELQTPTTRKNSGGDTEMGGTSAAPRRTATVIRAELAKNLRELVDSSVKDLEANDVHAKGVLAHYKQNYERKTGKPAPTPAPAAPKGILKNSGAGSSEHSPISPNDPRRMSAGHFFANAGVGQPVARNLESIGDIARRGSK